MQGAHAPVRYAATTRRDTISRPNCERRETNANHNNDNNQARAANGGRDRNNGARGDVAAATRRR